MTYLLNILQHMKEMKFSLSNFFQGENKILLGIRTKIQEMCFVYIKRRADFLHFLHFVHYPHNPGTLHAPSDPSALMQTSLMEPKP